jgi:hypothetical protein
VFFSSSFRLELPQIPTLSQSLQELARNVRHASGLGCAIRPGPLINSLFGLHLAHVFLFRTGTKEGACKVIGPRLNVCALFEILVVLFQLCGILGLCMSRLMPRTTRWCSRGKVGFVIALVGLGVAGALCGRHDSEFALFAGGTMTVLLIGMTAGSSSIDQGQPARSARSSQPELAA